jgi:hypothetical protein
VVLAVDLRDIGCGEDTTEGAPEFAIYTTGTVSPDRILAVWRDPHPMDFVGVYLEQCIRARDNHLKRFRERTDNPALARYRRLQLDSSSADTHMQIHEFLSEEIDHMELYRGDPHLWPRIGALWETINTQKNGKAA